MFELIEFCNNAVGPIEEEEGSMAVLMISYREADRGAWVELTDNTKLRQLLQTLVSKTDPKLVLNIKLEVSLCKPYKGLPEVLEQFGYYHLEEVPEFLPQQLAIPEDNGHLIVCTMAIKDRLCAFDITDLENEAVLREFVSPVLAAAVVYSPKIRMGAERLATGEVDYSARIERELILRVCITKESSISEGIAKNLMQLQWALKINQRRGYCGKPDYAYGVVATPTFWQYSVLTSDGKVCTTRYKDILPLCIASIDDDKDLWAAVRKIVATIAWMLQDRAQLNGPSAKRSRMTLG